MRRTLTAALALLGITSAQGGDWDIHYANMPWAGGGAGASATMDMLFTGVDANHDGVLSADELSDLSFTLAVDGSGFSTDYPVLPVASLVPCGPHPACSSSLTAFSFSTATHTFTAFNATGLAAFDDFLAFDGTTVDVYGRAFWDASHAIVTVTDSGTPPPIPEPTTASLLVLGLTSLGWKAGSRRHV